VPAVIARPSWTTTAGADYCSAVSAYEVGAHLLVLAKMVQDSPETPLSTTWSAASVLFVRRVSLDYTLVVVARRIPTRARPSR
jgi:hypothetical protein